MEIKFVVQQFIFSIYYYIIYINNTLLEYPPIVISKKYYFIYLIKDRTQTQRFPFLLIPIFLGVSKIIVKMILKANIIRNSRNTSSLY